jgi:hypothetical protein
MADRIRAVTTNSVVIHWNILDEIRKGNYAMLQSPEDANRIHGWIIAQTGDPLARQYQGFAEYDAKFVLVQVYEYRTGNNTSNSEMEFQAERELVKRELSRDLPAPLDSIEPPSFAEGDIGLSPATAENRKPVHIAKATVTAKGLKTEC